MFESVSEPYAELRPGGHHLMLLVRAAVMHDGRGGPWLTVLKTHTPAGTALYTHHIMTQPVDWYSTRRLVLLSGDEALAYTHAAEWPSITDPSTRELTAMATYAVELHGAHHWAMNFREWQATYCGIGATRIREDHTARVASEARGIRWTLAEQWLSAPADA